MWAKGRFALKHFQNNLDKHDLVPSQRKPASVNRRGLLRSTFLPLSARQRDGGFPAVKVRRSALTSTRSFSG
jgi:hypothetical protein